MDGPVWEPRSLGRVGQLSRHCHGTHERAHGGQRVRLHLPASDPGRHTRPRTGPGRLRRAL